jgi:hypothetical protein
LLLLLDEITQTVGMFTQQLLALLSRYGCIKRPGIRPWSTPGRVVVVCGDLLLRVLLLRLLPLEFCAHCGRYFPTWSDPTAEFACETTACE